MAEPLRLDLEVDGLRVPREARRCLAPTKGSQNRLDLRANAIGFPSRRDSLIVALKESGREAAGQVKAVRICPRLPLWVH